jgi:hypothetical protein
METEEVPQYAPPPRAKASRARSVPATPVPTVGAAAAATAIVDGPDVIPVPKARAKAKARGRSVEQVPVPKRKASVKPASAEPETPVLRPRAKSSARGLGPVDLPDVIPQMAKPRKKPNNMQSPAATAAALGKDPEPETTTKPMAKTPVPRSKRVPSAAPQGNRKPVVRKVAITPSVKVAAGLPGTKARKPRNKTPLVAEVEKLKA